MSPWLWFIQLGMVPENKDLELKGACIWIGLSTWVTSGIASDHPSQWRREGRLTPTLQVARLTSQATWQGQDRT